MSDDLRQAFREMFPGLEPGVRVIDGERFYSAAYLDDRHLRAVPDKEQQMDVDEAIGADEREDEKLPPGIRRDKETGTLYGTTKGSGELVTVSTPPTQMNRADAIFELAKLVEVAGYGHLNVAVHELPLQFFARPDMGPLTTLKSGDELFFTAPLEIGGHSFQCFSRGFPLEAE